MSAPRARSASRCGIQAAAADDVAPGRRHDARSRTGRGAGRPAGTTPGCARRPRAAGVRRAPRAEASSRTAWSSSHSTSDADPLEEPDHRCDVLGSAGTLRTTTGSVVSTAAARIGRAPFLLPAGVTSPESGEPTVDDELVHGTMTQGGRVGRHGKRGGRERAASGAAAPWGAASLTDMTGRDLARGRTARCSREWVRLGGAPPPLPRRRGGDAGGRARARVRRRRGLGGRGTAPRPGLRAAPGPRDRPPADGARRARAPAGVSAGGP